MNAYRINPVKLPSKSINFKSFNNSLNIKDINVKAIPAALYHLVGKDGKLDCVSFIIKAYVKTLLFWVDGVIFPGLIDQIKNIHLTCFSTDKRKEWVSRTTRNYWKY